MRRLNGGATLTEDRRAYLSTYWKRRRAERRAAGLCGACGRSPVPGLRTCQKHRDQRHRLSNPLYHREWRRLHPERYAVARLRYDYDLDKSTAEDLMTRKHGPCQVCGSEETLKGKNFHGKRRLSVDHDHRTRQLRGLLCNTCNQTIGFAKEDPTRLRLLAAYLEAHHARQVG